MTLEEIEKLCTEATPGPWEWDGFGLFNNHASETYIATNCSLVDADFITASRILLPKLLAIARAAQDLRTYASVKHDPDRIQLVKALKELENKT